MSKRKREIQKRKKLAEDVVRDESVPATEPFGDAQSEGDQVPDGSVARDLPPAEPSVEDSQIVSTPRPTPDRRKTSPGKKPPERKSGENVDTDSWLGKNKENLLLGLLVLYVFLLGLGTVGELFEIEWILNLPLFK